MRILVVDDELPIRSWISAACRSSLKDGGDIDTAKTGRDALEKLSLAPADIIFADISMPVMDGLEFVKEVRKNNEEVYIVILTNFGEFDYAREAFNNKADLYVLKSEITEQYIADIISKAQAVIKSRNSKGHPAVHMQSAAAFVHECEAFKDSGKEEEFLKKYAITLPDCSCFFMSLTHKKNADIQPKIINTAFNRIMFSLAYEKTLIICVSIDTVNSRLLQHQNAYNYAAKISISNPEFICCYADIADIRGDTLKVCHEVEKVILGANMRLYRGDSAYFISEKDLEKEKDKELLLTEVYMETIDAFNLEKINLFHQKVDEFFCCVKENKILNIDYIISLTEKICEKINYKKYGGDIADYTKKTQSMSAALRRAGSIDGIYKIAAAAANALKNEHIEVKYSQAVKDSLEFIHGEYSKIGGVYEIAEHVCLNQDYLSRVFKKETGHNISNYLNNFRLKQAVELLTKTDGKIYEIAEAVGFSDANYFSKKFKKSYGMSPYDYKSFFSSF